MRQWISIPIGNGVRTGFSWRVRRGTGRGCLTLLALTIAIMVCLAHPWLIAVGAGLYFVSVWWRYVR